MKIPQTPFSSLKMKPTLWKGEKKWGREKAKKPTRVAYENTKSLKIGFISTNTSDWVFGFFFSFFELCTFFYSSQMVFKLFSFPVSLNIEGLFYHWMKQILYTCETIYIWLDYRKEWTRLLAHCRQKRMSPWLCLLLPQDCSSSLLGKWHNA